MKTLTEQITGKLLSGRFLLTLIGGAAFLYCVITKSIGGATITAILVSIFTSYFSRTDRSNDNKSKSDNVA